MESRTESIQKAFDEIKAANAKQHDENKDAMHTFLIEQKNMHTKNVENLNEILTQARWMRYGMILLGGVLSGVFVSFYYTYFPCRR